MERGDSIERLASETGRRLGVDRDDRFRTAAVTIALLRILDVQVLLAQGTTVADADAPDAVFDGQLTTLLTHLQWQFPTLFPGTCTLPWDTVARRDWWQALDGGRELLSSRWADGTDVVSCVFTRAVPMHGKQADNSAYYTPGDITDLLLSLMVGDGQRLWERSVAEPACGSGAMLVPLWERVCAQVLAAQKDGTLSPQAARGALRRFARRMETCDIDPVAAWTAAAQMSVRIGTTIDGRVGNTLVAERPDAVTHPFTRDGEAPAKRLRGTG